MTCYVAGIIFTFISYFKTNKCFQMSAVSAIAQGEVRNVREWSRGGEECSL